MCFLDLFRCFFREKSTLVGLAVEDTSSTAEGASLGESEAVRNAAVVHPESNPFGEANNRGIHEASPSAALAQRPSEARSAYRSSRIESMIASRSKFKSELEFQMAHSQVHWSELSLPGASGSEDSGPSSSEQPESSHGVPVVDHRQFFEELQKDAYWGHFCSQVVDVVLGRKLGEGAQGVIYEAQVTFVPEVGFSGRHDGVRNGFVVKVMKAGWALEDLHRQWPRGIASLHVSDGGSMILYGALVKDPASGENRFGFVMRKYWTDLRTLIDVRMILKDAQGPPFTFPQAKSVILDIASMMKRLHAAGIIHRDLKAPNVLLSPARGLEKINLVHSNYEYSIFPCVADYECSLGIVGTGFWRAPEILLQLKNKIPGHEVVIDEAADVYSFGMTCYEIVTGLLPFEDLPISFETQDAILDGLRPKLPHDIHPTMKTIIMSCWNPNRAQRPTFSYLVNILFESSNWDPSPQEDDDIAYENMIFFPDAEKVLRLEEEKVIRIFL